MNNTESGAFITGNPSLAARRFQEVEQMGAFPFGRMFAWFTQTNENDMRTMARTKGREKYQRFVRTFPKALISELDFFELGIRANLSLNLIDRAKALVNMNLGQDSIGLMFPVNEQANLPDILIGNTVMIDGQIQNTLGFMTTPDRDYAEITGYLEEKVICGTSLNFHADERANGSGHHRLTEALSDFHTIPLVFFVPQKNLERTGPSTSIILLSNLDQAFLVREGSIDRSSIEGLIKKVGFSELRDADNVRRIKAYQYPEKQNLLMWGLGCYIKHRTNSNDRGFFIPQQIANLINS